MSRFLLSMYSSWPYDRIMSYTRWKAVRVTPGFLRTTPRYSSKEPVQLSSAYSFWFCSAAILVTREGVSVTCINSPRVRVRGAGGDPRDQPRVPLDETYPEWVHDQYSAV